MNSGVRYFLVTLAVILLLITGIVFIVRSGSSNSGVVPNTGTKLDDYTSNTNAEIRYTIEGPINAAENHRSIAMRVSPTIRQIDIIRGYQGEVINTKSYDNNQGAYSDFLDALTRVGFTNERRLASGVNATAVCPLGNRTHYQVVDAGKDVMNLWSASCTEGSFAGNISQTTSLFQAQFPDYSKITSGVNVGTTSGGGTGLVL